MDLAVVLPMVELYCKFYLEDILVLILFLIWFSHSEVTIIGWVSSKQILTGNMCHILWDYYKQKHHSCNIHMARKVMINAFQLNHLADQED